MRRADRAKGGTTTLNWYIFSNEERTEYSISARKERNLEEDLVLGTVGAGSSPRFLSGELSKVRLGKSK